MYASWSQIEHIQAKSACFHWLILEIWFLFGYWLANDVFLFSFWVFVWFFRLCFLSFALLHIYALFACLADNAFLGVVLFCRGIHIEVNYLRILIIVIYFISKDGRLVIFGHFFKKIIRWVPPHSGALVIYNIIISTKITLYCSPPRW